MVTKIKAEIVAVGEDLALELGDLLLDARRGLANVADDFVVEPMTVPRSMLHSAEAKLRLFNLSTAVAEFNSVRQRFHLYYYKTPAEEVGAEKWQLSELAHELGERLESGLSSEGALEKSPVNMLIQSLCFECFFNLASW
jgi:hypothetical protein